MTVRSLFICLAVVSLQVALAPELALTQSVQLSIVGAPEPEVVSIRPSSSSGPMRMRANPGRVDINAATVEDLIRNAFGEPAPIPPYRLTNVSKWMQTDRFDILATLPAGAAPLTPHSTLLALRKLLADRFNVLVRSEVSEGPVYVLSAIRQGGGLQTAAPCDEDFSQGSSTAPRRPCDAIRIKGGQLFVMEGTGVRLSQLAGQLSAVPAISRPVIDQTGLSGRYDFRIESAPPVVNDPPPGDQVVRDVGPSIFAALEEQLGLKLVSARGPVEQLIVISAERPTGN
jgi:uncharacterized protein (TIGR03435 family)